MSVQGEGWKVETALNFFDGRVRREGLIQGVASGRKNNDECGRGFLCGTLWFVTTKGSAEEEYEDDSDDNGYVVGMRSG